MDTSKVTCPLCNSHVVQEYFRYHPFNRIFFECGDCKLISSNPQSWLSPSQEKMRYDMHENNQDDVDYRQFLERLLSPLREHLLNPGANGLDYGSGPTPVGSIIMEEHGFHMSQFDAYYSQDISVLDRKYDFVIVSEVAEHFKEPMSEFKKIDSLVKKNGFVAIMTTLWESQVAFAEWYYFKDPTHICFYSRKTYEVMALMFNWQLRYLEGNVAIFEKL